jgi:NAD(P)-dependent dehydrogenase (short-subunit alcohol dehydrogenase family)
MQAPKTTMTENGGTAYPDPVSREERWRSSQAFPGPVQSGYVAPEQEETLIPDIPLRSIGQPEDVANALVFFASEQGGWITGPTVVSMAVIVRATLKQRRMDSNMSIQRDRHQGRMVVFLQPEPVPPGLLISPAYFSS